MNKKLICGILVAGFSVTACANASLFAPSLKTEMDKVSYAIGFEIGNGFNKQSINVQPAQFEAGFNDGLTAKKPAMTQEDMQSTLNDYQKKLISAQMAKQQLAASANQTASDAYLKKIAAEPGVTQIQPGLYYKVITAGTGKMPSAKDVVTVNYEGTLPDGTVFDSSYKRGQPATFPLNQVIPGWTAALQKMPVGSTWMLYIAPSLAYGTTAPAQIGPNQALTFKVELLSIQKTGAKAAKAVKAK